MRYTVVVVDDKPLIREAIIETINWIALNCHVVGEAENGLDAKKIISEIRPDIIITDIKMPGLDGLELTAYIRTILPNSKTIIITGYQDFEYAKKSVTLGVFDFILKPIKNDELTNVILRASQEIGNKLSEQEYLKRINNEKQRLEQYYSNTLHLLRNKRILDLINQTTSTNENTTKGHHELELSELGITALRHISSLLRTKGTLKQNDPRINNTIMSLIDKLKASTGLRILNLEINRDLLVIFLFDKANSSRESKIQVKAFITNLSERILSDLNLKSIITVSSLYKTLEDLPFSYKEVSESMESNYFKYEHKVLFVDTLDKTKNLEYFSVLSEIEKFYTVFEDPTNSQMDIHLENLMSQIINQSKGNIFVLKSLLSQICITSTRKLYIFIGDKSDAADNINEILSGINDLEDANEALIYMKKYLNVLRNRINDNNIQYRPIVKNILEFIHANFSKDISLDSVGEKFSINPSYLSRVLKKETGENFIDILTGIRIGASKKLLCEPQNRVNEVAEMVGYKDYSYFYQVFKRVEGISPTEYKKTNTSKKI